MLGARRKLLLEAPAEPLLPFFARGRRQRIDIVGLGDSNQLMGGHGHDTGVQSALMARGLQMYATGLVTQNENAGNGAGVGYGYNRFGAIVGATSGAPSQLHQYFDPGAGGLFPGNYAFIADGGSLAHNANNGLILGAGAIDNGADLIFDFHAGTVDSGSGSMSPSVRLEQSPYTTQVVGGTISTNTGAFGMRRTSLQLAASAARTNITLGAKWTTVGVAGVAGPFFGLYMRASNPNRTAGFSYHTLNARGGQSTRTMAVDLQQANDNTLSYFFAEVRRLQGPVKTVVIAINEGLNDRNEPLASVGPGAFAAGDSPEAFVDNHIAIVNRIIYIWVLNGWDLTELWWWFVPSHRISDPDDAKLIAYRSAITGYAATLSQAYVTNLADKMTSAQMLANAWYASGGSDKSHMVQAGYEGLDFLAVAA